MDPGRNPGRDPDRDLGRDRELGRELGRLPEPQLSPSPDAVPFWDACRRHELVLPYCARCERHYFYPRPLCPRCGTREVTWRRSCGRGEVYSFCIQFQSGLPGFVDAAPFVTAIVELEEGPRLMTFLVGVPPQPELIKCGLPVEVTFRELRDGNMLPVFRPRQTACDVGE